MPASGPQVLDLTSLPAVDCPCGTARRGFAERADFPGTVHLTDIDRQARTHYHREHTEVYVILECEPDAAMELDGQLHPVRPKTSILIPPGTRHRAVGNLQALILCFPKFDPADEHFD
jgi:mannose-6-phosphate isomerase-like protein (cupin superfamily)